MGDFVYHTPLLTSRLLSERTMLEMTVLRLEGVVPWERVFVLTNAAQAEAIRAELPFLSQKDVCMQTSDLK